MKKLILFLSFLLFNSLILSFATETPDPVLDSDGDEIRAGVEYYIMPFIWPNGGGLTYGNSTRNEICPQAVVQTWPPFWETDYGLPVTFTPVDPEDDVVRLSTDLNVKFSKASNVCIESNVWRVHFDLDRKQFFILTDGVEGNPGCGTIANWFKIERAGWIAYKLHFCPTVCSFGKLICKDVGRVIDDDAVRLALTDQPDFMAWFVKAESMKNFVKAQSMINKKFLKSVTSPRRVK